MLYWKERMCLDSFHLGDQKNGRRNAFEHWRIPLLQSMQNLYNNMLRPNLVIASPFERLISRYSLDVCIHYNIGFDVAKNVLQRWPIMISENIHMNNVNFINLFFSVPIFKLWRFLCHLDRKLWEGGCVPVIFTGQSMDIPLDFTGH